MCHEDRMAEMEIEQTELINEWEEEMRPIYKRDQEQGIIRNNIETLNTVLMNPGIYKSLEDTGVIELTINKMKELIEQLD